MFSYLSHILFGPMARLLDRIVIEEDEVVDEKFDKSYCEPEEQDYWRCEDEDEDDFDDDENFDDDDDYDDFDEDDDLDEDDEDAVFDEG